MIEANSPPNSLQTLVETNASEQSAKQSSRQAKLPAELPRSFPISVIMESRPSNNQWIDETWDAVGLVVLTDHSDDEIKVIEQGSVKQLIYSGLKITLYLDECESYYHNLMSPEPGCFIVAREDEEENTGDSSNKNIPVPFLITLSFDEAHSYLEGGDTVYAVAIPAELYRWAETYIVENYSAEKRKKRKRTDWKKQAKNPERKQ